MDNGAAKAEERLSRVLDHIAGLALGRYQEQAESLHVRALQFEKVERLPILFSYPADGHLPFQPLPNREIYRSNAAMLHNELVSAWGTSIVARSLIGDDLPLTIRPNWGTVVTASLLGCEPEQRDDQTPWIRARGGELDLDALAEANPDPRKGSWVRRTIETYEYYHERLAPYPELAELLTITLPDLQGPFDTLEQVMGTELFIAMILEPDRVRSLLRNIAGLQIACMDIFKPHCTERIPGFSHQHGTLVRGSILIRNDSVVMVSPEMYADLVAPADRLVLEAAGGGAIHSCGKIEHAFEAMLEIPGMLCFDYGQSWMNDVDSAYKKAAERGIPLVRVQPEREELSSGSIVSRFPTGVSLLYQADSLDDARRLFSAYRRSTC